MPVGIQSSSPARSVIVYGHNGRPVMFAFVAHNANTAEELETVRASVSDHTAQTEILTPAQTGHCRTLMVRLKCLASFGTEQLEMIERDMRQRIAHIGQNLRTNPGHPIDPEPTDLN